jgi:hypothetical protein
VVKFTWLMMIWLWCGYGGCTAIRPHGAAISQAKYAAQTPIAINM